MHLGQRAARDCGLKFLHTDPHTLYLRNADGEFYLSFVTWFVSPEQMAGRVVMHNGSPVQFERFRDRLLQLLRKNKKM
jgi:hypothetical protein